MSETITPAAALLLRCALGPPAGALAAWDDARNLVALDAVCGVEVDALCLAAARLAELDAADRALAVGLSRHAWAVGQLRFDALAAGADRPGGPPLVVSGRWATVVAYLPQGWVLPVPPDGTPPRWAGPTVGTSWRGRRVVVPPAPTHLVDCLVRRLWVDAACMAALAAPPWEAVVLDAVRRRHQLATLRGLRMVSEILEVDLVEPAVRLGLTPSRRAAAREQTWTVLFGLRGRLDRRSDDVRLLPHRSAGRDEGVRI